MSISALQFHSVTKAYAHQHVLQGIDLSIGADECFGLTGINGAGKTSLIKCLLDFCALDGGRIDIFGRDHRSAGARAPLAFLPERFNPPHYLNGRDFLRYAARLQGARYEAAPAAAMLGALALEPQALARPVRSYSKGMTQKLGLAACLLARKRLLILDEPMSGLDPQARALVKAQLRRVRADGGAVLLTSHALADVDELCDRIAILHAGRIRFTGTPQQCRAHYGAASLEQAFMQCIGAH